MDKIKLIVGLGNPGSKYAQTRHNAGFWFVDRLAAEHHAQLRTESRFQAEVAKLVIAGQDCWLLKPATFMNHSGRAVSALANYYRIGTEQILVAHDELDLPVGAVRLKKDGGHGGHNGLRDIIAALGGSGFWRLRIGIDHPGHRDQVIDYVLDKPSKADQERIEATINSAAAEIKAICNGEQQMVMNRLHRG
ncbi:MAG: aminoacyl-tRNA hydrolase [Gammaproteobacteria bacterium]|nr:aminoacyl-tRNA hydrolase [Gammaproteobacteria bacterium]